MAVVINGSGTVTGLAVGGLPDGTVDEGTLASSAVTEAKLATDSVTAAKIPASLENTFVSGRKNLIINGDMRLAQRGTSHTTEGYGSLDRYYFALSGGTATMSQQTLSTSDRNSLGFENYLRVAASAGNNNLGIYQHIEGINCRHLINKKATLSFYAKGTNPNGGSFLIKPLWYNTSSGGGDEDTAQSLTITSSWVKYSMTFDIPIPANTTINNTAYLAMMILQPASDTSTNAWELNVTGLQLEAGSTATDFEHRSYGEELALCQRYYYAMQAPFGAYYSAYGTRWFTEYSTYPVVMRANPSVSYKSGSVRYSYYQYGWVSDNLSALATKLGDQRGISLCITATGSYSPSNHAMYTAESNSYVANIDAEL